MRNPSFEFDTPDRITVGTVGPPGQRTFYLQARQGPSLATLKVEKEQMRQLADFFDSMLTDLPEPGPLPTDLDLESPVHEDWVVGTLKVAPYDEVTDRIHLLCEELLVVLGDDEPLDEEATGASAHLTLTRPQVAALVARIRTLLAGGRPTCALCGNPINPGGHSCPRTNGHASTS